jgi:GNAT superfamily N-acetyltransferase
VPQEDSTVPSDPPRVRPVHIEDAEALHRLYCELADGRMDALPAGIDLTREILTDIVGQPARQLLVAEVDGGRVVGTVDVVVVTNLTHRGRPWAIVENVVVSEGHRRRGIGRALMQAAIGHARSMGCYKVQLLSAKHRDEAHQFYGSLGLVAVAEGFRIYLDR